LKDCADSPETDYRPDGRFGFGNQTGKFGAMREIYLNYYSKQIKLVATEREVKKRNWVDARMKSGRIWPLDDNG
jgi:hypothetical protein